MQKHTLAHNSAAQTLACSQAHITSAYTHTLTHRPRLTPIHTGILQAHITFAHYTPTHRHRLTPIHTGVSQAHIHAGPVTGTQTLRRAHEHAWAHSLQHTHILLP